MNDAARDSAGDVRPMIRMALVTGTSSGIGRAIAMRLLDEGWRVTGMDRAPPVIAHPEFRACVADLADGAAIASALDGLGRVDAFVHAAGFMRTARLGEYDPAAGEAMWRVHVEAVSTIANILIPAMGQGGRIVVIGSRTAGGAAGRGQYAATKAALTGLVRSWAIELAPLGITANVVAPAATDTPFLRDPARAGTAPIVPPIGRFVEPAEIAALTSFLLGTEAGAITGQTIAICGGASL